MTLSGPLGDTPCRDADKRARSCEGCPCPAVVTGTSRILVLATHHREGAVMVASAWAAHFADVIDLQTPLTSTQVSVSDRGHFQHEFSNVITEWHDLTSPPQLRDGSVAQSGSGKRTLWRPTMPSPRSCRIQATSQQEVQNKVPNVPTSTRTVR